MNWKSTVLVSGAGVLATWLGVSTSPTGTAQTAPAAARAQRATPAAAPDIQQEAAHLQTKLRPDGVYRAPVRNPFVFSARESAPSRPSRVVAPSPAIAAPALPAEPAPPPFTLAGIGASESGGGMSYTAVLSTTSGVVLAHAGDAVAGGYEIEAVDESSVTVKAADGSTRRLSLRP